MATNKLINSVPKNMNPSGSATTFMQLLKKHGPVSLMSFAASVGLGGSYLASSLAAIIGSTLKQEAPDAIRMGILKTLGAAQPMEAGAFKSMVDIMNNVVKGESLINSTIKNFFKAGSKTPLLPEQIIPDEQKKKKLDKILLNYQENPEKMLNTDNVGSSYMPEYNGAVGALTAKAVNYLNGLRPMPAKVGPLEDEIEPSKMEESEFDNALTIAEQPLMILEKVKDGTITLEDMKHLQNIYPAFYPRLVNKMTHSMIEHKTKEESIPYATKMGLSLFMGSPVENWYVK